MLCKIGIAVLKWAVNVEDHSVFGENLAIPVKGQHAAAVETTDGPSVHTRRAISCS